MSRTLTITTLLTLAVGVGLYTTLNTAWRFRPRRLSDLLPPRHVSGLIPHRRRISDFIPYRPLADYNPYPAPLQNADVPESRKVAGEFSVFLYPGCSLEEHKLAVRDVVDLDAHIVRIFDVELPDQVWFHVSGISDAAVDAIRSDTSVALVECATRVYLIN